MDNHKFRFITIRFTNNPLLFSDKEGKIIKSFLVGTYILFGFFFCKINVPSTYTTDINDMTIPIFI